ncbi:MAG: ATP-binding protein [Lachnospiraceae bacterium]|nr:ATP-binding protein [Lachnospiraceae bacterium]
MKLQKLLSPVRRAIDEYHMIDAGDKIAVGISGGKDSLAMLYALSALRRFYPESFELEAITVSLGYENFDLEPIRALCAKLAVSYTVVSTRIGKIIFEERKEVNPCSLCSKLRKGAFNQQAKALGCNKVAYAHHKDDVVNTMLLSLLFEGQFYSFPPKTHLDRMDLTVIRPMIFVDEADVIGFKNRYSLPVVKNPCPADKTTKREYVRDLLRQMNRDNPGVKDRMFTAILKSNIPDWPARR